MTTANFHDSHLYIRVSRASVCPDAMTALAPPGSQRPRDVAPPLFQSALLLDRDRLQPSRSQSTTCHLSEASESTCQGDAHCTAGGFPNCSAIEAPLNCSDPWTSPKPAGAQRGDAAGIAAEGRRNLTWSSGIAHKTSTRSAGQGAARALPLSSSRTQHKRGGRAAANGGSTSKVGSSGAGSVGQLQGQASTRPRIADRGHIPRAAVEMRDGSVGNAWVDSGSLSVTGGEDRDAGHGRGERVAQIDRAFEEMLWDFEQSIATMTAA